MGYKAGMTHIVRDVDKPGSKLHKKETAEVGGCLLHACAAITATAWTVLLLRGISVSVQEDFSSELSSAQAQAQASPLPMDSCTGSAGPPRNCTGIAYSQGTPSVM